MPEEKLLEVITMAVKRKKKQHAGQHLYYHQYASVLSLHQLSLSLHSGQNPQVPAFPLVVKTKSNLSKLALN